MAFPIPSMLLKQLYTFGSLKNTPRGVEFQLKNRLSDATVTGLQGVSIAGQVVPLAGITIDLGEGTTVTVLLPRAVGRGPRADGVIDGERVPSPQVLS